MLEKNTSVELRTPAKTAAIAKSETRVANGGVSSGCHLLPPTFIRFEPAASPNNLDVPTGGLKSGDIYSQRNRDQRRHREFPIASGGVASGGVARVDIASGGGAMSRAAVREQNFWPSIVLPIDGLDRLVGGVQGRRSEVQPTATAEVIGGNRLGFTCGLLACYWGNEE
ncbi:hypothetical protein Salat_2138400 [Sesamum alatum]|uniref:Uncharacterized protein n=1 Tax=Sesamum alatum TaxID=300844 RepID=A0AAE2CH11_9LAMI|nr:hypothetical protein Salat_2138400 [Sesamum alatum]